MNHLTAPQESPATGSQAPRQATMGPEQIKAWVLGEDYMSPPPKPESANDWAGRHFPEVADQVPYAFVETTQTRGNQPVIGIKDLNENFWAQVLGPKGMPQSPTVYDRAKGKFFRFDDGIYVPITEERVMADLGALMDQCIEHFHARITPEGVMQIKSPKRLGRVVQRAKELLSVKDGFWMNDWDLYLPVQNGIYDHKQQKLLPFDPKFTFRSKLPMKYEPGAKSETLPFILGNTLDPEDILLLQKYVGQILLGANPAQKILVLMGDSGWGKGVLLNLIRSTLGDSQLGILRENLFANPYELSRYAGKRILVHPDMPTEFLNRPAAALFKQLVGGDPIWAENTEGGDPVTMTGDFNMILCCNGRPKIHLDEDLDAWRRRLAVVHFHAPKHNTRFKDLAGSMERIEGGGFLNWILEGAQMIRRDKLAIKLTETQEKRVNDLLLASEAPKIFVRTCLKPNPESNLTLQECYRGYQLFCQIHGIQPVLKSKFTGLIVEPVKDVHGRAYRHDLKDETGRHQRGWRHLRWDESEIVKN